MKVSASTISEATARLDETLKAFFTRRLEEAFAYLILDARYERVREDGVISNQAIGVDWEGRRQVLGVEMGNRESRSSWREFLSGLRERSLHGVEYVVSDNHAGLKAAIRDDPARGGLAALPDGAALVLDRRDLDEVRRDIAQWVTKWQGKYPKRGCQIFCVSAALGPILGKKGFDNDADDQARDVGRTAFWVLKGFEGPRLNSA